MKKFILFIVLMLFSVPLFALDDCFSGAWYDPERPGEGIFLEVQAERVVGSYYTFRQNRLDWYVFASDEGREITLYQQELISYEPFNVINWEVGEVFIFPESQNNLVFTWRLDLDLSRDVSLPLCLTDCVRGFLYTRLTQPISCN